MSYISVPPLNFFFSLLHYLSILPPVLISVHFYLCRDFSIDLAILSPWDILAPPVFLFSIPSQLPIYMVIMVDKPHHLELKHTALWPPLFNFSVNHWYLESNNLTETFWPSNFMTFSLSSIPPPWSHLPSYTA